MILFKNIHKLINAFESSKNVIRGIQLKEISTLNNAFLILDSGKIKSYGQMKDLNPDEKYSEEIDCSGKIVYPAYADSHTHLVYPKSRDGEFVDRIKGLGYEEIAKNGGGILNTARSTGEISEDELFVSGKMRLEEIIKMGTCAVEIKSGYGLSLENELKLLRAAKRLKSISPIPIKTTFLGAHAVPQGKSKSDYVDEVINEMLPAVDSEKLADYCDVFCDRGFFSSEDTDKILNAAAKFGMKAKIHANELDYSGGIQIGVKNNAISVDHLECTGEDEIKALKSSNTIASLLPSTAFFLGMEYPPARKMIENDLIISLASDYNPGSSPSGNMNFVLSLACIKMKLLPEEALNASTINGAHAMELGDEIGGIYLNKKANFIISEKMNEISFIPYNFGRPSIETIVINGKIIKKYEQAIN